MLESVNTLPLTDQQCDDRLVRVLANYVREKEMPFYVVVNILNDNLRDKSNSFLRLNQIIQLLHNEAI
jgi:hypothetical protein